MAESLTTLPIEALPSHLHFDHVGNLARFADVDLPDLPGLKEQVVGGKFVFGRYQYLGFVEGMTPPTFPVHRWIAPDSDIDLGGRTLKVLNLLGHTPDSLLLIDAAANRVFAGDFIYPSDIYAQLPGACSRCSTIAPKFWVRMGAIRPRLPPRRRSPRRTSGRWRALSFWPFAEIRAMAADSIPGRSRSMHI